MTDKWWEYSREHPREHSSGHSREYSKEHSREFSEEHFKEYSEEQSWEHFREINREHLGSATISLTCANRFFDLSNGRKAESGLLSLDLSLIFLWSLKWQESWEWFFKWQESWEWVTISMTASSHQHLEWYLLYFYFCSILSFLSRIGLEWYISVNFYFSRVESLGASCPKGGGAAQRGRPSGNLIAILSYL